VTATLRLLVTAGRRAGATIDVDEPLVLGRDSGKAGGFDDPQMSRRHALIWRDDDGDWIIEDAGSHNGTFVNGELVPGQLTLRTGDTVRVGETTFEVELDGRPPDPSPSRQASAGSSVTANPVGPLTAPVEQIGTPMRNRSVAMIAPPATLVRSGQRIRIPPGGLTIGRAPDNEVVVDSDQVSRHHARIATDQGIYFIADLGSMNGSGLNGERLISEARWLNAGDSITIGSNRFRFLVGGEETRAGEESPIRDGIRRIQFDKSTLSIGRDPSNDVQLDAPTVSRFHAQVLTDGHQIELRDLGSQNGTRLDGVPVVTAVVQPGAEIGIGPFRLVFDGAKFVERDDRGALRLQADAISVAARGKVLLDAISVAVQPGEFVAVIGESGAGKTTLIKVLSGVQQASVGSVLVSGDPVGVRSTEIGYLPQDEIVHARLTVLESLRYSARLRLPVDHSPADIDAAVEQVVREVSLDEHVDTYIGSLSGGQRKRVGLATELLTRPALLFLDEPTSGLDPGLESRMMQLFRELAAVGRSAVVVTTHATKNLDLADKLWVVGRGGRLCFEGSPAQAATFFGASEYDDIYEALEQRPAEEWRERFVASNAQQPAAQAVPVSPSRQVTRRTHFGIFKGHLPVLVSRYVKTFVRDRRNLLILLLQVPVLALGLGLLFKPDVFGAPGRDQASDTAELLFLLVTATIWLGTLDSAREIIKERTILARERAAGLDLRAYLASKVTVLFSLVTLQTFLLFGIVFALRPLDEPVTSWLLFLVVLTATGCVAVAMGLAISSIVRGEDQATAVIPISMLLATFLGGAVVTVKDMGGVMATLTWGVFERTAFAGVGSVADMNTRIHADRSLSHQNPYGYAFFNLHAWMTLLVLAASALAFLVASYAFLRRQPAG